MDYRTIRLSLNNNRFIRHIESALYKNKHYKYIYNNNKYNFEGIYLLKIIKHV